jgi:hypothetical protein
VRSTLLHEALRVFSEEASSALQAQLQSGQEIPFELASGGATGRRRKAGLQLYSPMTGRFIEERWTLISRLPSHAKAISEMQAFDGLDRYLTSLQLRAGLRAPGRRTLADRALRAFVTEVFHEQSDFELREGRLQGALARLDAAVETQAGSLTLIASLHGVMILSPQVQIAERLVIARPEALSGVPEQMLWQVRDGDATAKGNGDHLLVVLDIPDQGADIGHALRHGRELLRELLCALRLYGDGRIALGSLAWACAGEGPFEPVALELSGHPHGALIIAAEQEDELRAFCSLMSRRMPDQGALAWALRRFELGCERGSELEGLSDHLLALQSLLEPERVADGLLATRVARLCASAESREKVAARVLRSLELERDAIGGQAAESAAAVELAREIAGYLRALLRDVICGHLQPDLIALSDEMARADQQAQADDEAPTGQLSLRQPAGEEPTVLAPSKRPRKRPSPREQTTEPQAAPRRAAALS